MASMMLLKCAHRSVQRSLKPSMEFVFKLLYHAHADPLNVIRRILHIESPSWMTKSKLPCIFCTCSPGSVKPSSCPDLFL